MNVSFLRGWNTGENVEMEIVYIYSTNSVEYREILNEL